MGNSNANKSRGFYKYIGNIKSQVTRNIIALAVILGVISSAYWYSRLKDKPFQKICGEESKRSATVRCWSWCLYNYRCRREQATNMELGGTQRIGPEEPVAATTGDSENIASLGTRWVALTTSACCKWSMNKEQTKRTVTQGVPA